MGRTIAILQDILESSINPMEVEKAYLHYEAKADRKYESNVHSLWISSSNHDMGYLPNCIIIYAVCCKNVDFKSNRGENIYCI